MSPATATVNIRVADAKPMRQFIGAVADLIRSLEAVDDLPLPVMDALDGVRRAVAALGGRDIGPPPS